MGDFFKIERKNCGKGNTPPLFKELPGGDDSPVRNFKLLFATESTETTEEKAERLE
jgi:hypothetical protein